jgi:hypothetical protein
MMSVRISLFYRGKIFFALVRAPHTHTHTHTHTHISKKIVMSDRSIGVFGVRRTGKSAVALQTMNMPEHFELELEGADVKNMPGHFELELEGADISRLLMQCVRS